MRTRPEWRDVCYTTTLLHPHNGSLPVNGLCIWIRFFFWTPMGRTYLGFWMWRTCLKWRHFRSIMLEWGREAMEAERAVINTLFVWLRDHRRNYMRFLHLLLKVEVSMYIIYKCPLWLIIILTEVKGNQHLSVSSTDICRIPTISVSLIFIQEHNNNGWPSLNYYSFI